MFRAPFFTPIFHPAPVRWCCLLQKDAETWKQQVGRLLTSLKYSVGSWHVVGALVDGRLVLSREVREARLGALHKQIFASLCRVLKGREISQVDIEDGVQTAFQKLEEAHAHFECDPQLTKWLLTTGRRAVTGALRRNQSRAEREEDKGASGVVPTHPNAVGDADRQAILIALAGLPELERRIGYLEFYHGMTQVEAALTLERELGISLTNTKNKAGDQEPNARYKAARSRLLEQLKRVLSH